MNTGGHWSLQGQPASPLRWSIDLGSGKVFAPGQLPPVDGLQYVFPMGETPDTHQVSILHSNRGELAPIEYENVSPALRKVHPSGEQAPIHEFQVTAIPALAKADMVGQGMGDPSGPGLGPGMPWAVGQGAGEDWTPQQFGQLAANTFGVPWDLFNSQMQQESGWNQGAVSPAGAIGIGQLMPGTAQGLGVDPHDQWQNIFGAAQYDRQMYDKFGNWYDAIGHYNAGPGGNLNNSQTQSYLQNIFGNTGAQNTASNQSSLPSFDINAEAAKFRGIPYAWGGKGGRSDFGDNPSATDCSGFASYIYKRALGIDLPAQTQQAYNASIPLDQSQLYPGDLIFFNMNQHDPSMQHVGVFAGYQDGTPMMWHDSSVNHTGGVDITPIWSNQSPEFRRFIATGKSAVQPARSSGAGYAGSSSPSSGSIDMGQLDPQLQAMLMDAMLGYCSDDVGCSMGGMGMPGLGGGEESMQGNSYGWPMGNLSNSVGMGAGDTPSAQAALPNLGGLPGGAGASAGPGQNLIQVAGGYWMDPVSGKIVAMPDGTPISVSNANTAATSREAVAQTNAGARNDWANIMGNARVQAAAIAHPQALMMSNPAYIDYLKQQLYVQFLQNRDASALQRGLAALETYSQQAQNALSARGQDIGAALGAYQSARPQVTTVGGDLGLPYVMNPRDYQGSPFGGQGQDFYNIPGSEGTYQFDPYRDRPDTMAILREGVNEYGSGDMPSWMQGTGASNPPSSDPSANHSPETAGASSVIPWVMSGQGIPVGGSDSHSPGYPGFQPSPDLGRAGRSPEGTFIYPDSVQPPRPTPGNPATGLNSGYTPRPSDFGACSLGGQSLNQSGGKPPTSSYPSNAPFGSWGAGQPLDQSPAGALGQGIVSSFDRFRQFWDWLQGASGGHTLQPASRGGVNAPTSLDTGTPPSYTGPGQMHGTISYLDPNQQGVTDYINSLNRGGYAWGGGGDVGYGCAGDFTLGFGAGDEHSMGSARNLHNIGAGPGLGLPLREPPGGFYPPVPPDMIVGKGHDFGTPTDAEIPYHKGLDFQAYEGTPVLSPADGVVFDTGDRGPLGLSVRVQDAGGQLHEENHLSDIQAEPGDQVEGGQEVGEVGSTGNSTGPHLDYRVRGPGGDFENPDLLPEIQALMAGKKDESDRPGKGAGEAGAQGAAAPHPSNPMVGQNEGGGIPSMGAPYGGIFNNFWPTMTSPISQPWNMLMPRGTPSDPASAAPTWEQTYGIDPMLMPTFQQQAPNMWMGQGGGDLGYGGAVDADDPTPPWHGGDVWVSPVAHGRITGIGNGFRANWGNGKDIHNGVDIGAAHGEPVRAPVDGHVSETPFLPETFGQRVIIMDRHGNSHVLSHLSAKNVEVGHPVQAGQIIGQVGQTGEFARGPHVDYRIRTPQENHLDPMPVLGRWASAQGPAGYAGHGGGDVGKGGCCGCDSGCSSGCSSAPSCAGPSSANASSSCGQGCSPAAACNAAASCGRACGYGGAVGGYGTGQCGSGGTGQCGADFGATCSPTCGAGLPVCNYGWSPSGVPGGSPGAQQPGPGGGPGGPGQPNRPGGFLRPYQINISGYGRQPQQPAWDPAAWGAIIAGKMQIQGQYLDAAARMQLQALDNAYKTAQLNATTEEQLQAAQIQYQQGYDQIQKDLAQQKFQLQRDLQTQYLGEQFAQAGVQERGQVLSTWGQAAANSPWLSRLSGRTPAPSDFGAAETSQNPYGNQSQQTQNLLNFSNGGNQGSANWTCYAPGVTPSQSWSSSGAGWANPSARQQSYQIGGPGGGGGDIGEGAGCAWSNTGSGGWQNVSNQYNSSQATGWGSPPSAEQFAEMGPFARSAWRYGLQSAGVPWAAYRDKMLQGWRQNNESSPNGLSGWQAPNTTRMSWSIMNPLQREDVQQQAELFGPMSDYMNLQQREWQPNYAMTNVTG